MANVKRRKLEPSEYEEDEEDESYFCVDIDQIKQDFEKKLLRFVPSKNKRKFRDELAKLFRDSGLGEELGDIKPSDTRWKLQVDSSKVKDFEKKLSDLRTASKNKFPSIPLIINASVSIEKKVKALERFDVLNLLKPYSVEWLSLKEEVEKLISHPNVPEEQRLSSLDMPEYKRAIASKAPENKKEWYLNLPYNYTVPLLPEDVSIATFLIDVRRRLDCELYGMKNVKDEMIMLLHNRIRNPGCKSSVGLCGPPGVGKTSIAQTFARVLSLPFERIALGGAVDSSIFKGSDVLWSNAHPSVFISFLRRAGCANGIVLFDEIDKISSGTFGSEVQSSLLEVTDFTQNHSFKDIFLSEMTHDLSMLWFMFSMNSKDHVNKVLLDRIKIVEVPAYTKTEQIIVTRDYVFPRIISELNAPELSLDPEACREIVNRNSSVGLRRIEDTVYSTVSRFLLNKTLDSSITSTVITVKDLVIIGPVQQEVPRGMFL